MAISLLQSKTRASLYRLLQSTLYNESIQQRAITMNRQRLEKVMDNLQKNPYFEKYAQKIAKLQKTDPDEFLQRVEEQTKQLKQEKVLYLSPKSCASNPLRTSTLLLRRVLSSCVQSTYRPYTTNFSKAVYVTTPIFYVNAGPHIGHLYSAVLADTMARYNGMLGHSTFLATGTDEHGSKIQNAADAGALPVHEYCSNISQEFKKMCDTFQIDYSRFIRTTEDQHIKTVQHFWNLLEEKGHIYMGKYEGWYCTSDEAFLSEAELINTTDTNGNTAILSAASGNKVVWTEEDNYKFRLSAFQNDLKHWLRNVNTVRPKVFYDTLLSWIEDGKFLEDISISRPISRVPWGVPVPSNPTQTVYVWMDALVNYLTCIGYPDVSYKQYWPPTLQVIGKDILKFHGIYWPAFLIAAGLEPPKTILCHSHWLADDVKMSKSKGNVVSPFVEAERFTADGVRYFLLRKSVPYSDSNYSATIVTNTLNADLANSLGNLVQRCTSKSINQWGEIPPLCEYKDVLKDESALCNIKLLESAGDSARQCYEECNTYHVVDVAMELIQSSNRMFDHHKPWELRKNISNPDSMLQLKGVIALSLESVRVTSLILYPLIPKLANQMLDFLQVPHENRMWCDTRPLHLTVDLQESKHYHSKPAILFEKVSVN